LNEHAASHLSDEDLIPSVDVDAELKPETLSLDLAQELKVLEPFGAGNPQPVFMTKNFRLVFEPRVLKERHLKLRLMGADGRQHDAIWWDGIEHLDGQTLQAGSRIEAAYTLDANTWQGATRLQLIVKDLKMF
jgi:single-stranded-DNA-specific exonuclease